MRKPVGKADGLSISGERAALLVVDFQNDFCSPRGSGAERRGDLSRLERTAENLARALERARARGLEVVWIRFLGDRRFKKPNLLERDRLQKKGLKCLEGSWGAEFFRVSPRPGEFVLRKRALFDPFLEPALERRLRRRRIGRVLLAGVYLDICVDSTARSAFQKGYYVSVLADCTESLHYPKSRVLGFMKKYYGADISGSRRL